jgi:AAA family ATP:ADP antiporter
MSGTEVKNSWVHVIWPIEWNENKKFLPMAFMMFLILFNYSTLRSVKDGFVVTNVGPEAISFLKMYVVFPCAIMAMIIYSKLCNIMTQQKVFYTVTGFFVSYVLVFALLIYPNPDMFHPNPETIDALVVSFPLFKWFIKIAGKWTFATFYVIAELWGSMMLSLLFWSFANQITKTAEAKRFYSMFGMLGNLGLVLAGFLGTIFLTDNVLKLELKMMPVLLIVAFAGVLLMLTYSWIQNNVLTDLNFYDPSEQRNDKKKKAKLSLGESFKLIFSSRYIGMIALLVLAYGISINLVEGIWKAKIKELYPDQDAYTAYMLAFQGYQGTASIIFMIVGANILRKCSWTTTAMLTPIMILCTGLGFFTLIFFGDSVSTLGLGMMFAEPLKLAVMMGMVQNVLSKATKYSLFDATKNMAYIPLDLELKTKGMAAVEVVGGRLGKSGGGFIQSTFFMLTGLPFASATPYFAGIFFVIVVLWTIAVKALGKEYNNLVKDHSY